MRTQSLAIVLLFCLITLAPFCLSQDPSGDHGESVSWRASLTGNDAVELASKHILHHELQALRKCLRPPPGTDRNRIERYYGEHVRIVKPNAKQPNELHVYQPHEGVSLLVYYKSNKAVSARFQHKGVRRHETQLIGEDTYANLLHDLELKVNNLGIILLKLRVRRSETLWL